MGGRVVGWPWPGRRVTAPVPAPVTIAAGAFPENSRDRLERFLGQNNALPANFN